MIRQIILPFNLEKTNDQMIPHAGSSLRGEFAIDVGLFEKHGSPSAQAR